MTNSNFKESHPEKSWYPSLAGHQQRDKYKLGKRVIADIEARTKAIQEDLGLLPRAKILDDFEKK